jgi:site-specific recombinase XerD
MVQLVTATDCAKQEGIPQGFRFLIGDDMALIEAANLYLYETCVVSGKALSPDTQRTYSEELYDWFQTCDDNGWKWNSVTRHELALYRNRMLEQKSPATGRPYARSTINQRLRAIIRFYVVAKSQGAVDELPFTYNQLRVPKNSYQDPMKHARRSSRGKSNKLTVRETPGTIKAIPPHQLAKILEVLGPTKKRPTRNRLMAEAAVVTGMRRMEMCALLLSQVPDANEALACMILTRTKNDVERAVYPPSSFLNRLRWYTTIDRAKIVEEMQRKHGNAYQEPAEVFLTDRGTPVQRTHFTKIFKSATREAGIGDATLHWLRHTFALNMFRELDRLDGVNPWKALQVILGHASLTTTVNIYLDALQPNEADLSDSVENMYDAVLAMTPDA